MTEAEASASQGTESSTEGQTLDDIEQLVEESEAKGYFGETPDYDRDAYTLQTGPESPSSLEATLEAKRAEIDAQLDEFHERTQERAQSPSQRGSQAKGKTPTRKSTSHKES